MRPLILLACLTGLLSCKEIPEFYSDEVGVECVSNVPVCNNRPAVHFIADRIEPGAGPDTAVRITPLDLYVCCSDAEKLYDTIMHYKNVLRNLLEKGGERTEITININRNLRVTMVYHPTLLKERDFWIFGFGGTEYAANDFFQLPIHGERWVKFKEDFQLVIRSCCLQ